MALTLLCTLYDIEINIPELYSKENDQYMEPMGLILDTIQKQSTIIRQRLKKFLGTDLSVDGYMTFPVAGNKNSNKFSHLKKPTLTLTDFTTKESDTYILKFTDTTNFTVTTLVGASLGNGSTSALYTASDGVFTIPTANWVGTFLADDRFVFAYETHEDILRLLASYAVACSMLQARYVAEAANTVTALQFNYCQKTKEMFKAIEDGELELQCQGSDEGIPPSSSEKWLGYNIDNYGVQQDAPTT